MLKEFEYLGREKAYEVVVTNTNYVSDLCEEISPISPEKCPPVLENAERDIQDICTNKAKELYGAPLPQVVQDRLKRELDSIIKNGFSTLYIIAQRLVKKSNEDVITFAIGIKEPTKNNNSVNLSFLTLHTE